MSDITDTHCHHHFEWGVIFAGTAATVALSIILTQFGSIIGLSSDTILVGAADITHWAVIAIGLWLLAVQLSASAVGGYMAGRLRLKTPDLTPHENEVRDGFYGLTTWATSTIIVAVVVGIASSLALFVEVQSGPVEMTPDLIQKEQNIAIIFAFILGASSLVSAVIAWAAATLGGDHRDKGIDHSHYYSFRGR